MDCQDKNIAQYQYSFVFLDYMYIFVVQHEPGRYMFPLQMTPSGHTTTLSSPESIIEEYQAYAPCQGDDLGEFLSIYYQLWSEAHKHGVTGYGGITRLITLLPDQWRGWAVDMARDFITRRYPWYDVAGDLPQFLGQIHYYYTVYGQAPRGPYMRPGDLGRVPDMRLGDLGQIGCSHQGSSLVDSGRTQDCALPTRERGYHPHRGSFRDNGQGMSSRQGRLTRLQRSPQPGQYPEGAKRQLYIYIDSSSEEDAQEDSG